MECDAPVKAQSGDGTAAVVTLTAQSNARRIDLTIPNAEGMRYVTKEIFTDQCYRPVPRVADPLSVLDIGANVGLAAAYFRLAYPDAVIHCVEPDPRAFSFLAQNAPVIGNCVIHQVGLYEGDCQMPFYSSDNSVISSGSRNPWARAVSIPIQLRDAAAFVSGLGVGAFDLIKIDTEGAEVPIIRSLAEFIGGAAIVHIEFHSRDDRRTIDDLMNPSHCLFRGAIESAHRGHFTYVANSLVTYEEWEAPLSIDRPQA
jgi:FkbM family methyltransferase